MGCVFGDINSRAETPTSNLNLIENSTATRYVCQYSKRDGGKRFDFKIRIVSFGVLSNLLNFSTHRCSAPAYWTTRYCCPLQNHMRTANHDTRAPTGLLAGGRTSPYARWMASTSREATHCDRYAAPSSSSTSSTYRQRPRALNQIYRNERQHHAAAL